MHDLQPVLGRKLYDPFGTACSAKTSSQVQCSLTSQLFFAMFYQKLPYQSTSKMGRRAYLSTYRILRGQKRFRTSASIKSDKSSTPDEISYKRFDLGDQVNIVSPRDNLQRSKASGRVTGSMKQRIRTNRQGEATPPSSMCSNTGACHGILPYRGADLRRTSRQIPARGGRAARPACAGGTQPGPGILGAGHEGRARRYAPGPLPEPAPGPAAAGPGAGPPIGPGAGGWGVAALDPVLAALSASSGPSGQPSRSIRSIRPGPSGPHGPVHPVHLGRAIRAVRAMSEGVPTRTWQGSGPAGISHDGARRRVRRAARRGGAARHGVAWGLGRGVAVACGGWGREQCGCGSGCLRSLSADGMFTST
jgi:hypothetical protein